MAFNCRWLDQTTWGVCYHDLRLASVLKSSEQPAAAQATIIMSTSESDSVKQMLSQKFHLRFASGAGYKLLCTAQRRVQAYVLSKTSIYLWDCCAPHAILRATGGGVVGFRDTLTRLQTSGTGDALAAVKDLQVLYTLSPAGGSQEKSIDGIIAYSCEEVLATIMQSLAL